MTNKGNLKREIEYLLIVAQNNAIKKNYIKAKLANVNYVVKEMKFNELVQKVFNTRHDWVGKVIHWKLCKKLKFDYTANWYRHQPESILENKMHKVEFLDTDRSPNLIQITRPSDCRQKKKRTCQIVDFAISTDHRVKLKENEKRDKCQDIAWELKK